MELDISARFTEACKKLIESGVAKNYKDIAAKTGIGESLLTEIKKGRANPGAKTLNKLVTAFPEVSFDWLISGKGSLSAQITRGRLPNMDDIKDSELDISEAHGLKFIKLDHLERIVLVPHITIPLYSMFRDNIEAEDLQERLPKFPLLKNLQTSRFAWLANHFAFTIFNESLESGDRNSILAGDIVIAKQMSNFPFVSYEPNGLYVVVAKENIFFGNVKQEARPGKDFTKNEIQYDDLVVIPTNGSKHEAIKIGEEDVLRMMKIEHVVREFEV